MRIDENMSHRLANMSFVCACLIVLLHCTPAPVPGSWAWWVCHLFGREGWCVLAVPYFFFAAGFLLAGKYLGAAESYVVIGKRETLKRVQTLLIPYAIWMAITLVRSYGMWYCKTNVFHVSATSGSWTLPFWEQVVLYAGLHPFKDIGIFWFIRCLFFFVVLSPLLARGLSCKHLIALMLAVAYAVFLVFDGLGGGWDFYFFFDRFVSIRGLLWFFLGMCARTWDWEGLAAARGRACGLFLLGMLGLAVRGLFDLKGCAVAVNLLEGVCVPLLLFGLLGTISTRSWPKMLVGNAFAIFLAHNMFLSFVAMGLMAVGLHGRENLLIPIMIFRLIAAIAMSIALAEVLRRCCPRVAEVVYGGR